MSINKHIFITSSVLILSIIYFGVSDIDIVVQDYFYNHETHKWILDWSLQPYKFIFYDGAKRFLILFAVSLLISSLIFRKKAIIQTYKKGIMIIILSAIFVPSLIGLVKNNTNMPCPKNDTYYGGIYPKTAVWEKYPLDFEKPKMIYRPTQS